MGKDLLAPVLRLFGLRTGVRRITPEALKQRMDRGDQIEILDVRYWSQVLASGGMLPGAKWVERTGIESHAVPGRAFVLYCD